MEKIKIMQNKLALVPRIPYERRTPIYKIAYDHLSELHDYYNLEKGNKVHVFAFALIICRIFIKKLKKAVLKRRSKSVDKNLCKFEKINLLEELDPNNL